MMIMLIVLIIIRMINNNNYDIGFPGQFHYFINQIHLCAFKFTQLPLAGKFGHSSFRIRAIKFIYGHANFCSVHQFACS